jgi:hypothetical protein
LPFLPRLCFSWGSLDLLPSTSASSTHLPFLPSKMTPPPPRRKQSWWRCRTTRWSRPWAAPEVAHEVPAGHALEEGVHDLGLGYTRELSTALGEASYEVPGRLARLPGARSQVPRVRRAHVCALEVPCERAHQVVPVVDLAGWQVLEPRQG